jgi:hypothetical protein
MKVARTCSVPPTRGLGRREITVRERRSSEVSWSIVVTLVTMVLLSACGAHDAVTAAPLTPPDDISELDEAEEPGAGLVAPTLIPVVTYEGSGQLVHPDAAVFPARWQGKRYWVSGTPYPAGNPRFENPSIYQGRVSNEMRVPLGVTNPIVSAPVSGYMSDPDILYDPESDQLRMYYRETSAGLDEVLLITSQNGVQWSAARLVASEARYSLISPSIVRESATSWRMWTVNASAQGCFSLGTEMTLQQRRSVDGVSWGQPELVNLHVPGRVPWHWDVQYVAAKSEYWALVAAYPEGTTCSRTAVYFARSADGTTWKVSPTPLLSPGEFEPLRDVVYRSSFHYHDGSDAVSVWFSGARLEGNAFRYAVASARYPYSEMLRRVGGASPIILEREASSAVSPELQAARTQFEHDFP